MIKRPLLLAAAFVLAVPCFADEETCSEVNTFEKTGECFKNVLQLFKNVTASTGEILQNLEKKLQEKDAQLKRQSDDISALKLKVPSAVGLKGDKGEPGYHGMPGISGLKGEKGEPAPIPLYTSKGVAEKGEKGDHGEEGLPGLPGLDGLPGISGLKGKHGCDDARKP